MDPQLRTAEQRISTVATEHHGCVSAEQLLAAGLSETEIKRRLSVGLLIAQHRGVYRVGHRAPSVDATYMAAVLACGEGALLSGGAGGHLLEVTRGKAPPPEVTAPGERDVPGVITRRARRVGREGTVVRGIPVTTVAETLVDLAATLGRAALARACHEAGFRYDTTPREVEVVLNRRRVSKGSGKLRSILHGDTKVTLSRLESCFLELVAEHGFPRPEMNRPADTHRVDCRWPRHALTVELDSYRFHRSRHAWEKDRQREREARNRGDEFRRFTWEDVSVDPTYVLSQLHQLLP